MKLTRAVFSCTKEMARLYHPASGGPSRLHGILVNEVSLRWFIIGLTLIAIGSFGLYAALWSSVGGRSKDRLTCP